METTNVPLCLPVLVCSFFLKILLPDHLSCIYSFTHTHSLSLSLAISRSLPQPLSLIKMFHLKILHCVLLSTPPCVSVNKLKLSKIGFVLSLSCLSLCCSSFSFLFPLHTRWYFPLHTRWYTSRKKRYYTYAYTYTYTYTHTHTLSYIQAQGRNTYIHTHTHTVFFSLSFDFLPFRFYGRKKRKR